MSIILQVCRRTGALAEDCGGNFACDNACALYDVEFVPASERDRLREALERIALAPMVRAGSGAAQAAKIASDALASGPSSRTEASG